LILEDRTLIEDVIGMVKSERVQAEYAFSKVIQRYFDVFSQINDEYLKERVADIRDVGRRLLANLCGHEKHHLDRLDEPVILLSHDLSPSDTASLDRSKVLAFVTESGGPTSHTAILGRSLEIPAIVGAAGLLHQVNNGDLVIVDGSHGIVIISPDEKTVENMTRQQERFIKFRTELDKLRDLPAETIDGRKITLAANIEFHYEMDSVISHGAEGTDFTARNILYEPLICPAKRTVSSLQASRRENESAWCGYPYFRLRQISLCLRWMLHEMNPYLG
jgi:phosphotransferase system enzyme I (PtsI)